MEIQFQTQIVKFSSVIDQNLKFCEKFFFYPSLFEFELQQKLFSFEGSHYAYR